ncbi:hypothetical protein N7463_001346 [Penicillium fimorum]|uniref:Uncharacterized protein n=1 Tax=Penicillium fimorum TaxID=1882269 RepID=A0A9W9Y702_9EURO|nr:hypothetical protein N7463_001346 [Penicillium fimorum]
MSFPFYCEPFYMRPLLTAKSALSGFYKGIVYLVIPIVGAVAIFFVIYVFIYFVLALTFGWDTRSDKVKEKTEKENKEYEYKDIQGKSGVGVSVSTIPNSTSDSCDTVDPKKRLEIEIEILGELLIARRERLVALKKMDSDDGLDLEVLEKME